MSKQYNAYWNKISASYFIIAFKYLWIHLSRSWIVPPQLRPVLLSWAGHQFSDRKSVFIGADVLFDNVRNAKTCVGRNVTIATGTKIMNHYVVMGASENHRVYNVDNVYIEDNVFIGMNVLITRPLRIGKGSIVAAGSVVTADVPPGVVVAGVPAKIIKSL